jgi:hypothetical protein
MPIKYAVPAGSTRTRLLTACAARYTGGTGRVWEALDGLDTHPASQTSGRFGYSFGKTREDHRGVKQRTRPMCGFKRFVSAERFCQVYEEVRNFFRVRSQRNEPVSLAWQRLQHLGRMRVLMATLAVA